MKLFSRNIFQILGEAYEPLYEDGRITRTDKKAVLEAYFNDDGKLDREEIEDLNCEKSYNDIHFVEFWKSLSLGLDKNKDGTITQCEFNGTGCF